MRTGADLIRTMLFTIVLALALGGTASAAQLFDGGTRGTTARVDDRSRSAQNDDGEDRDGEDTDDEDGDKGDKKDEPGQIGEDEQDGQQGEHGQEGEFEGEDQG